MALLRRCRGIIFDLDDTLVPTSKIDRAAIRAAATQAFTAAEAIEQCCTRFAHLLKTEPFPTADSAHDIPSWRTLLWARALAPTEGGGAVATDAPVSPAAKSAYELWCAERLGNFRFADDVAALIKRLNEAGYKTGVLTNGAKEVQRGKTTACGADALFGAERVVVAGEYPEQKPHPSIFKVACAALGEEPERVIMVGDSYPADIAGGHGAGLLATVWVHPGEEEAKGSLMFQHTAAVPEGQPPPTHTVRSVLELEAVLDQIG